MLNVNEIFDSIQGEGSFTGYPVTFVRLQGCDVGCSFCDTPYAQHNDEKWFKGYIEPFDLEEYSAASSKYWFHINPLALAAHLKRTTRRVVFTGGEPLLQSSDLWQVIDRICDTVAVHIETSGTVPLNTGSIVHSIVSNPHCKVTVSPKEGTIWDYYQYAYEVKVLIPAVVTDLTSYQSALKELLKFERPPHFRQFQPIWYSDKLGRDAALENAIYCAQQYNGVVSLQTHKLVGIP